MKTVMFNPYTGTPRHPSDIASDPQGLLILEPGAPLRAALEAKNEAETRELKAAQETDELRAALKAVLNHWREFGPDHGFEECIERATRSRGFDEHEPTPLEPWQAGLM